MPLEGSDYTVTTLTPTISPKLARGQHAPEAREPRLLGTPYVRRDPRSIPPREWLYGRTYLRGILSVLVSPGGVGKTALTVVEALAMAIGSPLLGEAIHGGRPLRVWYWNGEDPREEVERKIEAACLHFGIGELELGDRLMISDPETAGIRLGSGNGGAIKLDMEAIANVEATIMAHRADVAIFDPFISMHGVAESDNNGMDEVGKSLARMAMRHRMAVGVVHHARKPPPGGSGELKMEDSRGASSLSDVSRVGRLLDPMSETEAAQCGVAAEDRRSFVRIHEGKASLAPRADKARWVRLVSVDLGNATANRPSDQVGVPEPWTMPGAFDGVTVANLIEVQRRVAKAVAADKPLRQDPQAKSGWVGIEIADVLGLDIEADGIKAKIKAILATWIKTKVLKVERLVCPDRQTRPCIVVGEPADKVTETAL